MSIYDIIIIGGGPAGMTAGIYAGRGGMDALLIESPSVMGQAIMTDMIENYPGVEKATGIELMNSFKKQALEFGLKTELGTVNALSKDLHGGEPAWKVEGDNGVNSSRAVIIATGAVPKKLGVPGEEELVGRGVSYCATCDGAFFKGKDIVVVGGGDTAVEEAIFLTRFAGKVKIIHRRERLRAARIIQDRAFDNPKIDFRWNSVVEEIGGGEKVQKIKVKDVNTAQVDEMPCEGVFIFAGWKPNTGFLEDMVELDEKGHIIVDDHMRSSKEGVFAAGDCCRKSLHQVVTACGDGAIAAYSAQHYVEELKGTAYK